MSYDKFCPQNAAIGQLEPSGFTTYLMGKMYPLLECTDFQGSTINNDVVIDKYIKHDTIAMK